MERSVFNVMLMWTLNYRGREPACAVRRTGGYPQVEWGAVRTGPQSALSTDHCQVDRPGAARGLVLTFTHRSRVPR
eukprot:7135988-Prymnesium_polylepis.1